MPVGLGEGVGDCHDVANLPRVCLFISLLYLFGGTNFTLFPRVWFLVFFFAAGFAGSQVGAHPMLP